MRPLRSLAIYIAVVFIGGALLAPQLYFFAQWIAPHLPQTPFFDKIAHGPFHRYENRAFLGLALLGIWPLLRSLGTTSLADAGLVKPARNWGNLGGGFLFGFISLAIIAALALAAHVRQVHPQLSWTRVFDKLPGILLTASSVAVLEEILFRGAVYGSLRKIFHWMFALVVSSMIYAIVHFLERAEVEPPIHWYSGLQLLPRLLHGFIVFQQLIPGFLNLTLAGALLALAYQRTNNLYFSIGLHAGWIFWLKSYNAFTANAPGASTWLWGSNKLVDGWIALPILAATLFLFAKSPFGRRREIQREFVF